LIGIRAGLPFSIEMFLASLAVSVLLCAPFGWWLGLRHRLPLSAQLSWGAFHLLTGVPGLLTFLAVHDWPAREKCPKCNQLRVVDREECEHCGAKFAPPQ